MNNVLSITDVTVQFPKARGTTKNALRNVSMDITLEGSTIGIVGESGSGKTTLGLSILNLIERPGKITAGRVDYNGRNVLEMTREELRRYRWKEVSVVFQSAMNALNPVKTITSNITEVIKAHSTLTKKEALEHALTALSQVGISAERANDYAHQFSGGMRQRVIIAMALSLSPRMLIADEPTSALDVVVQEQILNLLSNEVTKKNLSLLFITHEIAILGGLVQDVVVMQSGEIVERGPTDKVLSDPLHPYTEMLVGSLLSLDSTQELLRLKHEGRSDSNRFLPENCCQYSDRCKYAFEKCRRENPRLQELEKGRWVACHKYS